MAAPVVETALLIRRPAGEAYEAFADPAVTTRFWFTSGSGRLEPGAKLRWDWEMYGVGTDVSVVAAEPGRRIVIDWDTADRPTRVEWTFEARGEGQTLVKVVHGGFHGTAEEQAAAALDSMGGFSLVLAGAKAWLEHGLELGLVRDRHPDAWVSARS